MSSDEHVHAPGVSVIVVPPNDPFYSDPVVVAALEAFLQLRFPSGDVEVAWVRQPRIAGFTVVGHGEKAGTQEETRLRARVLAALAEFDPSNMGGRPN